MDEKKKILIVDDIELNRAILGELFKNRYDILEAENGKSAISTIQEYGEAIVVILLDIIMPELDGFGVLEQMDKLGFIGRIPVVMITAETGEGAMQKSYSLGASEVISKPFAPNIILQRVSNIVEQYTYRLHLEKLLSEQATELRIQANKLRENSMQIIDVLSAIIEFKNTESVSHIHNIRTLTRLLMLSLASKHPEYAFSNEIIDIISESASMHDIGKVTIPDSILNKPGKLTAEEFEIMKTHTIRGCEILDKLTSVQHLDYYNYCYEICRYHHERFDGNGYPDGLKGNQIPIWAQVVSLADVYDALTTKRVYKEAYSSARARQMILNGECGQFNPIIIESFLEITTNLQSGEKICPDALEKEPTRVEPKRPTREDLTTRTLRLLEIERQKYKIMSELSGEILFEYDKESDSLLFSEKYHELTGKQLREEHAHEKIKASNFISQSQKEKLFNGLENLPFNQTYKQEIQIDISGNGLEWFMLYLYPILDSEYSAKCIGYLGKLLNINEQKIKDKKLRDAANLDPLTGLLNRSATASQITKAVKSNLFSGGALCFLDIDNFKYINDNFGHPFGDKVLKFIADVFKHCTRSTDIVGRMGGDEFVIFYKGNISNEALDKRFNEIKEAFSNGCDDCKIYFSMGICRYSKQIDIFEKMLQCADQALYLAKRQGKNRYNIYQESER